MKLPKLNEKEKQELRIQIEAEIYRRSLYDFFVAASKVLYRQVDWDYNWHFKYLCDEVLQPAIMRVINKQKKPHDLIINLCRRSGKSILVSQIMPVWILILDSSMEIMQVSHAQVGAVKNSFYSKILMESDWFKARFPEVQIRVDTHAKQNYMTTEGGKRISFGITSASILGEGCMIQICDDISSPFDSNAVTMGINDIYNDVLYGTLNNDYGLRIISQQRVSTVDICGYLLDKFGNKFLNVCVPARLSPDLSPPELQKYYTNDLFWESRFNDEVLIDRQLQMSSRAFAGQYMQRPMISEGGVIKRAWIERNIITSSDFNLLTDSQKNLDWNLFVDTAHTKKKKNDFTGIIAATAFQNNVYIKFAKNYKQEFPELMKTLKQLQVDMRARMIYMEDTLGGKPFIQQLRHDGFNVQELSTKNKDKLARANTVTPSIEGGHLFLIKDSWNELLLSQLAAFTGLVEGETDDLVDCVVYSIDTLLNQSNFNYSMI